MARSLIERAEALATQRLAGDLTTLASGPTDASRREAGKRLQKQFLGPINVLTVRWATDARAIDALIAALGELALSALTASRLEFRQDFIELLPSERVGARLLRRAGVTGWVANFLVLTADGVAKAELDFAFPDLRICIEVDGRAAHSGGRAFDRDRRRQNDLSLDGWLVLRFTWHQIVNEPEWVIGQIRLAIATRSRLAGIS